MLKDSHPSPCAELQQELGVGTMSLYHYVKNKAKLIAAMDDALMADVVVPALPKPWRDALCQSQNGHAMCTYGIRGRSPRCNLLLQASTRCVIWSNAFRRFPEPT